MRKMICGLVAAAFFAMPLMAQTNETVDEKVEEVVSVVAEEPGAAPTTITTTITTTAPAVEVAVAPVSAAPAAKKEFNIYTERLSTKNHYIPSGWMGDSGDIQFNDSWREDTHSGNSCMKIKYSARGAQGAGWAGIYWQNPANNWGSQMGGYDLSGYNKLVFWARGEKGGEVISEFKVGGLSGAYSDSDATSIGPITLTKDWKQYDVDLKGLDLSYISGGFAFTVSARDNPEGCTFYLDDIKFE